MTLSELCVTAHDMALSKGFWGSENQDPMRKLALVHSEVSEALECLRDGHGPEDVWAGENGKPEGFGVELADAVVRICDLAGRYNINLEGLVEAKLRFNATRPMMHGKTA